MNKLTKEQADWLLEEIIEHSTSIRNQDGFMNSFIYYTHLKDIINQCTEKEFPWFAPISDLSPKWYPGAKIICLVDNNNSTEYKFNIEQFKAFTQGCIKICEWLD